MQNDKSSKPLLLLCIKKAAVCGNQSLKCTIFSELKFKAVLVWPLKCNDFAFITHKFSVWGKAYLKIAIFGY